MEIKIHQLICGEKRYFRIDYNCFVMEIKIHQLICGENDKKAWDCLQTTLSDKTLARQIAFKSDMQDLTGSTLWQPTVRGFIQDNFFLVMRIFPDKSPQVRPGRAFAHVLVLAKSDVEKISDLQQVFSLLMSDIEKSIVFELIHLRLTENHLDISYFQNRFNKVIHGYVNTTEFKNTFIWVGAENFEIAVSRFWQILPLDEKLNFNFGINFNIDTLDKNKINFITTPESIRSKFMSRGFCVVEKTDTHVLKDVYEQLLAGDSKASQRIEAFKRAIEVESLSRNAIERIARVIETFENLEVNDDLSDLRLLGDVIADFSPLPEKGTSVKAQLIARISELVKKGHIKAIIIIKIFKLNAFEKHQTILIRAIQDWLKTHLFSRNETTKTNFYELFDRLSKTEKRFLNWWTTLIHNELKQFLTPINPEKASIIFNWLRFNFNIFETIRENIPQDAEPHFVSQFSLPVQATDWIILKKFAQHRYWYLFHAKLLVLEYSFEKALNEQLLVDTQISSILGIELITNNEKSESIIAFAIENGDERVIEIAGKRCKAHPTLLESMDLKNSYWQQIWLSAVKHGNQLSDGFAEPQQKIHLLFDLMLEGNRVNPHLLEKISHSEYANLRDYDKMTTLWNKLAGETRSNFLKKTSASLLEALSKDSTIDIPNDKILEQYIVNYAIKDFLYYNRDKIKNTLPIFKKLSLPEYSLTSYINNYPDYIDIIDAIQLGELVSTKNYSNVASTIYNKCKSTRSNWKTALGKCYRLLNKWDKFWLVCNDFVDAEITADEWWNHATEIIIYLYENQIKLKTVWKKAGGKESELLTHGTTNEIWQMAISELRKDKFKEISMKSLLKEIQKDYENNERFKIIYELRKKFIRNS